MVVFTLTEETSVCAQSALRISDLPLPPTHLPGWTSGTGRGPGLYEVCLFEEKHADANAPPIELCCGQVLYEKQAFATHGQPAQIMVTA